MIKDVDQRADTDATLRDFIDAGTNALQNERFSEAISTLQAALELCRQTKGTDNAVAGTILEKLALAILRGIGPTAAAPIQERVVASHVKHLGAAEPRTPSAMCLLGIMYDECGRKEDARAQFERAVRLLDELDEYSSSVVASASALGAVLSREEGRLDFAEKLLQKALRGLRHVLGEDAIETLAPSIRLAYIFIETNREKDAEVLLHKVLNRLAGEKETRAELGEALMYLGRIRASDEQYDEAVELFTRAEATYQKVSGEDSVEALGCRFQRGSVYREQGKIDAAEAIYQKALADLEATLGRDHIAIANVADAYAELLDSVGRKDEAREFRARANTIRKSDA